MKFRILSDLHMELDSSWAFLPGKEDAVLYAGDMAVTALNAVEIEKVVASVGVPFFYVMGNHDAYHGSYGQSASFYRDLEKRFPHFRLLQNEAAEIGGYRVLGTPLWTDFALRGAATACSAMDNAGRTIADFNQTVCDDGSDFLEPKHLRAWNREARGFLSQKLAKKVPTVVITHWSPTARATPARFENSRIEPYFTCDCENLFSPQVALWVHGHSHSFDDRTINGTRLVRNPRGYPGEQTAWQPDLIIELPTHADGGVFRPATDSTGKF